ncbi:MAG: SPOR domain-containing protein [Rhodocyclaceae bacterium]|nr:SPOR domain-containing protein [Rhodocyclaceae bacterium]
MPTLRLIFFALLLANVAFFAWQKNAGPAEGHEPLRLQQEIEPDKLRLILPEKPEPAPEAKKPEPASAESKTPEPAVQPAEPAKPESAKAEAAKSEAPKSAEVSPTLLCKSFAGFTPESAKAAQAAINSSAPATKVALISSKDSTSYWVHIPAQSSKAGAEKKVAELKQMGVDDSFIIADEGPNKWAVSLGLFKSKDMADNYLQRLIKQGVRSAKIEVRDKGTEKVRLEVTAPAEALGVLAREIKPLASATLGECKPAEVARN